MIYSFIIPCILLLSAGVYFLALRRAEQVAVIAGGPRMDSPRDILQMAHDSIAAGGAGLSMGRNIFQAEDPTRLVQALHAVVHMDYSVDQAMALLEEPKL